MRTLVIIGASGHGRVVADIAEKAGYERILFLDDNINIKECGPYSVVGRSTEAIRYKNCDFFVAIGNAVIRRKLQEQLKQLNVATLIHPNAIIGKDVRIGIGTVVMAGAVINPGSQIGDGCIINTCASVDHDCCIGDYVHVSVGSHLAGSVKIKDDTWVGAGATIINNINVTSGCMIGAGAVVVKDIIEKGTYLGVPAKNKIEKTKCIED